MRRQIVSIAKPGSPLRTTLQVMVGEYRFFTHMYFVVGPIRHGSGNAFR
jgi:hypothetical protein